MKRHKLSVETASLTDIGMVRKNNEDSLFVIDKQGSHKSYYNSVGIYIIADGLGGHQGGEIASEIATREVSTTLLDRLMNTYEFKAPFSLVKEAIEKANVEIYKRAGTR